jgi:uncharacterized membrane protein
VQKRGLPGPALAHDTQGLAGPQLEVHVPQPPVPAPPEAEALGGEQGLGQRITSSPPR